MKMTGVVDKLHSTGDLVKVTVSNIRRNAAAQYAAYEDDVSFKLPESAASKYPIGRKVEIYINGK